MADEVVKVAIVAEDKTGPGVASAQRNLQGFARNAMSVGKGFLGAAGDARQLETAAGSATSQLSSLKVAAGAAVGAFAAIAGSAIVGGIINIGKGALQSYSDMERLTQSIGALTAKQALLNGSASSMQQALAMTKNESKELLAWIQQLAIASPFRQDDVANAFRLAMALGFSTKESQRLTAAMLDFATATGAGGETIERVNRALGQMKTKGKVSLEEINQLTEGGVDAMRILRDATGKTGEALYKDISKGAISADFAIEAIIADTEKLYKGAGAASAGSMAGLLSSLQEMEEISARNLLAGMFEAMKEPIGAIVSIVSAPEFQQGITAWGEELGRFTSDQIDNAAAAMERIGTAITPLLNQDAPGWLVGLQALAAAGGEPLKISVTPTVTSITTPDGGLTVDVTAHAVTVTTDEDTPPIKLTAAWQEGTIGSIIAATNAQTREDRYKILVNAGWYGDALKNLQASLDASKLMVSFGGSADLGTELAKITKEKYKIAAEWDAKNQAELRSSLQAYFAEPIAIFSTWADGTLQGLWQGAQDLFKASPLSAVVSIGDAFNNMFGGGTPAPAGVPSSGVPFRAVGSDFFQGGPAVVAENGPELLDLPRGTRIYNARDTKALLNVPHFAEGTTPISPALRKLLGSVGLWGPHNATMGPKTRDESGDKVWVNFNKNMENTAKKVADAFDDTAKKVSKSFEGALSKVPGLFGTSQVTEDQMKLAKAGVPQNFADDYIRQLSDEVLNGKDWGSKVDIKDAAKRAGIDPNLPNEIILDLVKQAWSNGSFFADKANLELINQDAVKANMEQQQKQMQGQLNIKSLFGITDEDAQKQIDEMGTSIATIFGGAADSEAVKSAGATLFGAVANGMGDPATANKATASMAGAIQNAAGTADNAALLDGTGAAHAAKYYAGWAAFMGTAPVVPPGGAPAGAPPAAGGAGPSDIPLGSLNPAPIPSLGSLRPATVPTLGSLRPAPGRAIGTGYWSGGWMQVHANETIYAPRGATVLNPRESTQAGAGITVINNVTVNKQIDEEAFMGKVMRRIRRAS